MKENIPIIGVELLNEYNSGDLVKWCSLNSPTLKIGIILEIFTEKLSERKFPLAKIYVFGEDEIIDTLLSNLIKISDTKD